MGLHLGPVREAAALVLACIVPGCGDGGEDGQSRGPSADVTVVGVEGDTGPETDIGPDGTSPPDSRPNLPPGPPEVVIRPTRPTTADDITAVVVLPSTDPDNDPITYTWRWLRNGELVEGLVSDTVPSSALTRGDVWRAVVIPNDGRADGPPGRDEVTIGNSAPTVLILLEPESPGPENDVNAVLDVNDPDDDDVAVTHRFQRRSDGLTVEGTVLPATRTFPGDVWTFRVTAVDSLGADTTAEVTFAIGPTPSAEGCPVAVAGCRRGGSTDALASNLTLAGSSWLECRATGSFTPRGTIRTYRWSIATSPDDALPFISNPEGATTEILLDRAGTWTIELDVTDTQNTPACRSARVDVVKEPAGPGDLAIQLTWTSPGVPDPGRECAGCGTDLDLHMLNLELGCWTRSPADLHWRNRNPMWESPDDPVAVPCSLTRDDISSLGPEIILCQGLPEGRYRLGVHYFSDHRFGPSTATLRVTLGDSVSFNESQELTDRQFWDVADLELPSGSITRRGTVYPTIAQAPCP
jgi:hypothetical protein